MYDCILNKYVSCKWCSNAFLSIVYNLFCFQYSLITRTLLVNYVVLVVYLVTTLVSYLQIHITKVKLSLCQSALIIIKTACAMVVVTNYSITRMSFVDFLFDQPSDALSMRPLATNQLCYKSLFYPSEY